MEYKPGADNHVADALSRKYNTDQGINKKQMIEWAEHRSTNFAKVKLLNQASTTLQDITSTYPTTNYNWKVLQSIDTTISTEIECINGNSSADLTPYVKVTERAFLLG